MHTTLAALAATAAAPAAAVNIAPTVEETRFERLAEAEWQWRLDALPMMATSVGEHRNDDRLDDVEPEARAARLAHWQAQRTSLAEIDPARLTAASRVNRAVLLNQIDAAIARLATFEVLMPLNGDSAFYDTLTDLPESQPLDTEADYRRYLARLADIPRFFAAHEALMREGLQRGYTVPQQVLRGRDQPLAAVADIGFASATPFFRPFKVFPPGVPAAAQPALREAAAAVIQDRVLPAYRGFLAFLRDTYVPQARQTTGARDLPDGRAFYQARIREYTTLDLTPEAIHALGLAEVARIQAEMQAIMDGQGDRGTFTGYLAALRADPAWQAKSAAELLARAAWIAKRIDGLLPRYFGRLPRQPYGVAPVPDALAPFYTSGRYVPAPQPTGASGTYWVNTHDLASRPLYLLPALTLHEAVPGHHLQIALAAEDARQPPYRRWGYLDVYGEGWALYAEHLGLEMGIYETPQEQFGRLSFEMWRACRLVVDTGLHAFGWTPAQARDYLLAHTAMSPHEAATEVDRYVGWPGQALAYKIGEMKIRALRARAEAALGPRFDLRDFHDTVLGLGAVPLQVLADEIEAWIASRAR